MTGVAGPPVVYRHRQSSNVPIGIVVVITVVVGAVLVAAEATASAWLLVFAVSVFAAVLTLLFGRLTVTVYPDRVEAAFGRGWPRRLLPFADLTSARQVRNKWWYGWGIRMVPRGWMYNVWGLDAIELERSNGKVFRIGTDEPAALMAALGPRLPVS